MQAAEGAASWAQHMLSALVKLLEQMTGHERLVLTVYGTTKVTAADFTTSATPNVKTALLPLGMSNIRLSWALMPNSPCQIPK